MYAADLVVGAGGTMTREAALMGVPTLSVFAGKQPAVDRWLEERGALRRLTTLDQVAGIRPRPAEPRTVEELRAAGAQTLAAFIEATAGLS
jgi:predicted glycosyltransferase